MKYQLPSGYAWNPPAPRTCQGASIFVSKLTCVAYVRRLNWGFQMSRESPESLRPEGRKEVAFSTTRIPTRQKGCCLTPTY